MLNSETDCLIDFWGKRTRLLLKGESVSTYFETSNIKIFLTFAPCLRSSSQYARPIPAAAPVTRATFPFRSIPSLTDESLAAPVSDFRARAPRVADGREIFPFPGHFLKL